MANDFINEDELPSNWVEAPARVIVPGQQVAAPPVGDSLPTGSRYFSGTIAPQLQHDVHFVNAGAASPRLPSHDLMPLAALSAISSAQTQAVIKIIQQSTPAPAPVVSGGGTINGTTTAPFIPYTASPDTLADSTWEFTPTGNVLSNTQSTSGIELISGGNDIELGLNTGSSFPTFLDITDSAGDNFFVGMKPAFHEALFSISDSLGDGVSFTVENGFGVEGTIAGASGSDNIFFDVDTNNALVELESGLGGSGIWELRTSGASDWEMLDQGGSFAEIFQDGSGTTSYFQMEDAASANVFQVDINKGGTPGTVAVTLKSPAPSIALGSSTSSTIFAGSGAPSGSAPNASMYLRSDGTHAGLSLLYLYDANTSSWVGVA